MRRRAFIAGLGGTVVWPVAARAQERLRHIGVLVVSAKDDPDTAARVAGFRQGLERLGWVEGRNIRIDYRYAAGQTDRFQPLARELIALQPEAILAHSTPIAAALQREVAPSRSCSPTCPIRSVQASSQAWRDLAAI